jgi:hypothetical protein
VNEIKAIIQTQADRSTGIQSEEFSVEGLTDLLQNDIGRQEIRQILHDAFVGITTMPVSVMFSDEITEPVRVILEQDYYDCPGCRWIARVITHSGDCTATGYGDTMQEAARNAIIAADMEDKNPPIYVPADREVNGHGTG